jgi:predicted Zn-dependent peptidase
MKLEQMGDFHRATIDPGTQVFIHPTAKFKTATIKVVQIAELGADTAGRALVPALLRRGSVAHPSMAALSRALESLYGASLGYEVQKFGDRHAIVYRLDVVHEKFLPRVERLLERAVALFAEVLHQPLTEKGGFRQDFVAQEKVNQVRSIQALLDDKIAFARLRLIEEMFRGEPFAQYELGSVAEIEALDPQGLYRLFERERASRAWDIYFVGDLPVEVAASMARTLVPPGRRGETFAPARPCSARVRAERVVTEEQDISQSKLVMGYRVDMTDLDERGYFALGLYNAILGGGSHSKLFKQVREKNSLAYYASSGLDRLTGVMFIQCGINASNFERALELAQAQTRAVAAGEFDADEMAAARKLILNRLRSITDEAGPIVDFFHGFRMAGRHYRLTEVMRMIELVDRDDVVAVAGRISPDTVYFLRGLGEDHGA